jgi:nucleoside phosphorylase
VARALLITAIPAEFQAVLDHFAVTDYEVDGQGTYYTVGNFQGKHEAWRIGVIQVLQGNTRSAILTALGVTHFRPDVVLLVGVAGALKDLRLGDVVAAPVVRGYERGKETDDGFLPRGEVFNSAHRLVQAAQHVVSQELWQARIVRRRGTPKAVVETIAAGEKLLVSDRGPVRELLRKHVSDAVAVEMEGLGVLAAAQICEAKALVIRAASDNLADKDEADKAEWQPTAAGHAAAFAFELLAELRLPPSGGAYDRDAGGSSRATPPSLPPSIVTTLEQLRASRPDVAAHVVDAFRFPPAAGAVVMDELVSSPPDWLESAPAQAWSLVGSVAELYNAPKAASSAYERAARLRPPLWWRWLARAAAGAVVAGDVDRARGLMAEASAHAPDDVFVLAFDAALRNDYNLGATLTDRTHVDDEEALLLDGYLAVAQWQNGEQSRAAGLLNSMMERYPDKAGPPLVHAQLLLTQAITDKSHDRMHDLELALNLAIQARDRYHSWGGAATRAIVIAGEAALAADDPQTALRLALSKELGGDATDVEAADSRVIGLASKAAILAGRDDIQAALAPIQRGTFSAALMDALRIKRESDADPRVVDSLQGALELASSPSEVFAVLFHLADAGAELPLSKLEEIEAADPELADIVRARAESAAGNFEAAQNRLRKWSGSSAEANRALGHTHAQAGEIQKAIDVFRDGAKRFGTTTSLLDGVDVALAGSRPDLAEAVAEEALLGLPLRHPGRRYALGRLIEIAARRQEWRLLEERARLLRREADSEIARWALTIALYNQTRLDEAWSVASENPALTPSEPERARLMVSLLGLAAHPERALQDIVAIAERFPADEEVVGMSLLQILTLPVPEALVQQFKDRVNAIRESFILKFPESAIFRQVAISGPEEFLAEAQAQLEPGSEELYKLEEAVRNGDMPYGLLAVAAHTTYAEAIATRGAGFLVAVAKVSEDAALDQEAARVALGQSVVVDTSAFGVNSELGGAWGALAPRFHKVYATDSAVRDVVIARRKGRPAAVIVLDRRTGQAVPVPVTPERAKQEMGVISRMAELMVHADQLQSDTLTAFPDLDNPESHLPWLSPLQIASDRGLFIWSDDTAQRKLAREMGLHAFGTFALLEVLSADGRIDPGDAFRWQQEMIQSRVGDIPVNTAMLLELAASNGWGPGPVSQALARPSAWNDHTAAIVTLQKLFEAVAQNAPDQTEHWFEVGLRGSAGRVPKAAHLIAGGLLAMALATRRFDASVTPNLVAVARVVCKEFGAPDPLPAAVQGMLQTATELLGPQQGAALIVRAFSQVRDVDRGSVNAIVFGKR